jgi:two-component system CheB/CheR fusion protein
LRVLVVDDYASAASSMVPLLQSWGFEVRLVRSAAEAVESAARLLPDSVLIDLAASGTTDGCEVARVLRHCPGLERTLLICLTGYYRDSHRRLALAAGCNRYLVKPADLGELKLLLDSRRPHTLR